MVSGKLVHLIESHWDEIVTRAINQIHREPSMSHNRPLLEAELREWAQILLTDLGHWLSTANEESLAHKYQQHGRSCCEDDLPLHHVVCALCALREKMLDFVEENISSKSSMELYEEEELDRRLSRLFDLLIVHLVEGYERAMRKAALINA